MTRTDRSTLQSVRAEIQALYRARGRRNFTADQERQYERLLAIEQSLIQSPEREV
jgi:hypothetical protein